jgi:hypothetical protein
MSCCFDIINGLQRVSSVRSHAQRSKVSSPGKSLSRVVGTRDRHNLGPGHNGSQSVTGVIQCNLGGRFANALWEKPTGALFRGELQTLA